MLTLIGASARTPFSRNKINECRCQCKILIVIFLSLMLFVCGKNSASTSAMSKACPPNLGFTLILAVSLAMNLNQLLSRQPCHPCGKPEHRDSFQASPLSEQQVYGKVQETEPEDRSSLQALPSSERRLYEKVLETNYSNIWMSSVEINLVLRNIHGKEKYLEWGSGGSTMNFPKWVKKAVSIEHDPDWCGQMKSKLASDDKLQHVDYHCVPIERGTNGWGNRSPLEEGDYTTFHPYVDEIQDCGVDFYDIILIDGRSRVDCAIRALSFIKDDSVVILHDSARISEGRYGDVATYYDFKVHVDGNSTQGLAVMKRKPEFSELQGSHEAVQKILDERYPELERN